MAVETTGAMIAASFERSDDDAVEAWVAALPKERVVETLHAVTELARALRVGEKMLKSRVVGEEIIAEGEQWTAPDGRLFFWAGDRERICADPAGLRDALAALPLGTLAKKALAQAFVDQPPKVYLTHLDGVAKFGGDEAEKTVRSFVTWKSTAPKLRAVDEERR